MSAITVKTKFQPIRLAAMPVMCPSCHKVTLTVDKTDPSVHEPCGWCGYTER